MTRTESALSELISEVDAFMDQAEALHVTAPKSLDDALESAKTALRYHRPHEHCFDRTNNERKD